MAWMASEPALCDGLRAVRWFRARAANGFRAPYPRRGPVPRRITYDNTKVCIAKIIGPRAWELTEGFKQLLGHYLFDGHFCLVRRANEKGVVQGTVNFPRLNFLVPVPQVRDFDELNTHLLAMCREDLGRRLWGKQRTKAQLLEEDRVAFRSLPEAAFGACRTVSTIANSQSLVRFDSNDCSVPVEHAHHPIVAKGYVDQVVLCCGSKVIAQGLRCWDKERQIFDPRHYLRLVHRRPGSLDHALPLEELALPECFPTLRRRLESEREDGTREYVGVLRLLEKHSLESLTVAVEKGLRLRAHCRDGIAQFLLPPGALGTDDLPPGCLQPEPAWVYRRLGRTGQRSSYGRLAGLQGPGEEGIPA